MTGAFKQLKRFAWIVVGAWLGATPAIAQTPPDDDRPADGPRREGLRGEGPRPPGATRPADGLEPLKLPPIVERLMGGNPFKPMPEDFAPLREGELDELLTFARVQLDAGVAPADRAFGELDDMHRRDPQRFRAEMGPRIAARLRHMKRLSEQAPEHFSDVIEHIRNGKIVQRLSREWSRTARPMIRQKLRDEVRAKLFRNIGLQGSVLERMLKNAADRRDVLIDDEIQRLIDGPPPPPGGVGDSPPPPPPPQEPAELREMLRKLRSSTDAAEIERVRSEVRARISRHMDRALNMLRERREEMLERASADADRQTEEALRRAESNRSDDRPGGERPHAGPRRP
ncbi:MAG: hypothetical protein ACKVS9_14805 [Phycisphaerae bacterium]